MLKAGVADAHLLAGAARVLDDSYRRKAIGT
jgi:hypothetical protein